MSFENASYLELEMRKILQKAVISSKEQYRVYERPGDLVPKYTIDFLIIYENKKIAVECDGFMFHSSAEKKYSDRQRDLWLKHHGISFVIRLGSYSIFFEEEKCIKIIRAAMEAHNNDEYRKLLYDISKTYPKKSLFTGYVTNVHITDKLHKVNIYTATCAMSYDSKGKGGIAFLLYDQNLNIYSNEFSFAFDNVDKKSCQVIVLLEALKQMKKPAILNIYTESKWIAECANDIEFMLKYIDKLEKPIVWLKILEKLKQHNYRFIFVNPKDNHICRGLLSRAKQKAYRTEDALRIKFDYD